LPGALDFLTQGSRDILQANLKDFGVQGATEHPDCRSLIRSMKKRNYLRFEVFAIGFEKHCSSQKLRLEGNRMFYMGHHYQMDI
jgi:hypothetical protein